MRFILPPSRVEFHVEDLEAEARGHPRRHLTHLLDNTPPITHK